MGVSLRFVLFTTVATVLGLLGLFGADRGNASTVTVSFSSGLVCADSAVNVDIGDNARQVTRTLTGPDGTIRALSAGTGSDLVFYNPNHPDVRVSLKGNGAVAWTTTRADETSTRTLTGHNIVFYFPTDTLLGGTPGPATLLIVGREVINVDAASNFTQVSESGEVTDLCALLPPD